MRIGLALSVHGDIMLWRPIDPGFTVIGSNPECDLCLPVDGVAPVHCVLRRDDNRHPEGTRVGAQMVSASLQLARGDVLHLGPVEGLVEFKDSELAGSRTRTLEVVGERRPSELFLTAPSALPQKSWALSAIGISVGVDPGNDLVLDDPFVSSFHARFTLEGGRCIVRDLTSRNGVFVGEQKIREGEVPTGVAVRLGKTTFVVVRSTDLATTGPAETESDGPLVGISRDIARVREVTSRLAEAAAAVLILGETGTGKEVVARLLHDQSPRAARPFVAINCGSLSRELVESELFGHERGAFTGAVTQKIGAFEAAHRGTLFLDEVGELPLALQPQLLRVLETGEVRRVGSTEPFAVDVRIVAATNRRLEHEVAAGRFREDLYHRLHVLTVELPPLRERDGDIEALARHFLDVFAAPGHPLLLTPAAQSRLAGQPWPGNVRELRNVIQRAVLLRHHDIIDADDITFTPSTLATRVQTESATSGRTLLEIERDAIIAELRRQGGNKKEAATALGVSRSTIHRKIEELEIDVEQVLRPV